MSLRDEALLLAGFALGKCEGGQIPKLIADVARRIMESEPENEEADKTSAELEDDESNEENGESETDEAPEQDTAEQTKRKINLSPEERARRGRRMREMWAKRRAQAERSDEPPGEDHPLSESSTDSENQMSEN